MMEECISCHRISKEEECNNLQCPFCGGNMLDKPSAMEQYFPKNAGLVKEILDLEMEIREQHLAEVILWHREQFRIDECRDRRDQLKEALAELFDE